MDGANLLTAETAKDKAVWILKVASKQLKVDAFLQCAIQIVAHVGAPGADPDAKTFVQERFMRDGLDPTVLGPDYFGGGVRFRSVAESGTAEDSLLIEPFIQDNKLIFLSHDVARIGMPQPITDLDHVATWITEAFEFLAGPAMDLLEN
jgi:hypothetical protein